ncbi:MAG: hypothetical protein AB7E04_14140 [Desulfobacteraceae bacterium]|jgi:hypothetical protein
MSEQFFGAGDVYIDRFDDNGNSTGLIHILSTQSFSLKSSGEQKQLKSRSPSNYGQVIASVALPGASELKITHNEFDAENMAMAFLGDTAAYSQEAGTLTTKEVVIKKVGNWFPIGFRDISKEGIAVVDELDAALAEGTDFEINYAAGLIRALSGGSVQDGDLVKVSGTYTAVSGTKIYGATKPIIKGAVHFEGINLSNGKKCVADVWRTTLQPDSEVNFLSDDFGEISLSGSPEVVTGKTSTFEIIYI